MSNRLMHRFGVDDEFSLFIVTPSSTGSQKIPWTYNLPYTPDLAPSDFYLFPNMNKWLAGNKFHRNVDIIAETNAYLA